MRIPRLVAAIVLPQAAAFAVCLAFSAWASWWLISKSYERQIERQILAETFLLKQRAERLKVVAVVDAIDYRLFRALPDDTDSVYALVDGAGQAITGNLDTWPRAAADAARGDYLQFTGTVNGRVVPVLARFDEIDSGYRLLVGRSLSAALDFRRSVARVVVVAGAVLFVVLLVMTLATSVRVNRRFQAIGNAIDAARGGDRAARAQVGGRDEIAELAVRVNEMLATLDRQMYHLKETARVIAHEFRTPLSVQKRVLDEALSNGDVQGVEAALTQAESLLDLSNSLLEIAEHETAFHRSAEPQDLATVLNDQHALFEDACAERGVTLEIDATPCHVPGDRWLLTRLIANLIENAIEVSRAGQTVRCACRREAAVALLTVTDEGPGIPHEDIDMQIAAATPARRADSSGRQRGLGLRVVRAIALRHGGRVRLRNLSPGLEVTVTFAAAANPDDS
ncbi:MAG: HAMP domain-containing sensor histidine kinase [Pseudomonadota bacterium]